MPKFGPSILPLSPASLLPFQKRAEGASRRPLVSFAGLLTIHVAQTSTFIHKFNCLLHCFPYSEPIQCLKLPLHGQDISSPSLPPDTLWCLASLVIGGVPLSYHFQPSTSSLISNLSDSSFLWFNPLSARLMVPMVHNDSDQRPVGDVAPMAEDLCGSCFSERRQRWRQALLTYPPCL
jgi:hypothetical protein